MTNSSSATVEINPTLTAELMLPQHAEATTSSRLVAAKFGKSHKHVLRNIEELLPNLPEIDRSNFGPIDYTDTQGRKQPEYLMTRDTFLLLAMGFTGRAALAWKLKFIGAFNAQAAALGLARKQMAWEKARRLEQAEFHDMQLALMETRHALGKETRRHHFSNEARLVGFAMTGLHVGLDRDSLDADQLKVLRIAQTRNAALIRVGVGYEARKEQLRGLGALLA